jgi:hypothetical protein
MIFRSQRETTRRTFVFSQEEPSGSQKLLQTPPSSPEIDEHPEGRKTSDLLQQPEYVPEINDNDEEVL